MSGAGGDAIAIEASYYRVRALANGETVARTIDINGGGVLLDVDSEGKPLGIEMIGHSDLVRACWLIVCASRWTQ